MLWCPLVWLEHVDCEILGKKWISTRLFTPCCTIFYCIVRQKKERNCWAFADVMQNSGKKLLFEQKGLKYWSSGKTKHAQNWLPKQAVINCVKNPPCQRKPRFDLQPAFPHIGYHTVAWKNSKFKMESIFPPQLVVGPILFSAKIRIICWLPCFKTTLKHRCGVLQAQLESHPCHSRFAYFSKKRHRLRA